MKVMVRVIFIYKKKRRKKIHSFAVLLSGGEKKNMPDTHKTDLKIDARPEQKKIIERAKPTDR